MPTKQSIINDLTEQLKTVRELREGDRSLYNRVKAEAEYHKQESERHQARAKDLYRDVEWHRQMNRLLAEKIPNVVR